MGDKFAEELVKCFFYKLLLSETDALTLHHHPHVRRDKELLFEVL
jgi:hypothetical protein